MVTLMTWGNSAGSRGRCDGKCHGAKSDAGTCRCMCGGRFHGRAHDGTLAELVNSSGAEILEEAELRAVQEGLVLTALDADEMLTAIREKRQWKERRRLAPLVSPEAYPLLDGGIENAELRIEN